MEKSKVLKMNAPIKYRGGYKYILAEDAIAQTQVIGHTCESPLIDLYPNGVMLIRAGYAWDGPSGPTVDDRSNIRGSIFHDAFYQLIRQRIISPECKDAADATFRQMCRDDGMNAFRAWYYFEGVHWFGSGSCHPGDNPHPVLEAP